MTMLMKTDRSRGVFDLLCVVCVMLGVCVAAGSAARAEGPEEETGPRQRKPQSKIHERITSASFHVGGSGTGYATMLELYKAFTDADEELEKPRRLLYESVGNEEGLKMLADGKVQMAVVRIPSVNDEELPIWDLAPPGFTRQTLGAAPVVILIHEKNPVRSLSVDQVEALFRADADNWSDAGGLNRPVNRFGTTYPALSWGMFTRQVLHGKRVGFPEEKRPRDTSVMRTREEILAAQRERRGRFPGSGPFPRFKDDAQVAQAVAKDFNGIGYCILPPDDRMPEGVKAVGISPAKGKPAYTPTHEHILLEEYPLQETLWLVVGPNASEAARAFLAFATTQDASKVIASTGLRPVQERQELLIKRRVAAYGRGEGDRINAFGNIGAGKLLLDLAMERTKAVAPIHVEFALAMDFILADDQRGLDAFFEGQQDLLFVDGKLTAQAEQAYGDRLSAAEVSKILLGGRAVALVVNAKNLVASLTPQQVKQVFHGQTESWKSLGGAQADIKRYGLPGDQPVTELFYSTAIDQHKRVRTIVKPNDQEVIKSIMFDELGIGYVNLSAVKAEHLSLAEGQPGIKVLAIGSPGKAVRPSAAAVVEGTYPYSRRLTLLVSPKAQEAAKSFARFIGTYDLQAAFAEHGFVQALMPQTAR